MTDPTSLPDFPPSPSEHPLRGRVLDVLLDEGYRPDIDEDGDVAVKVQGQRLFLRCAEGAVTILRIFGQWRLGDAVHADQLTRLLACNTVNSRLTVAKLTLIDDVLVVSAEHVVTQDTPLRQIMPMSLDLVLNSVNLWHEAIVEITGVGGDGEAGR